MRIDDLDAVLGLFDRVAAEDIWIGTESGYDRERYRDIFGLGLSLGHGMFVAHSDGTFAGMLTTYRNEEYGWTLGMMVERTMRDRGVGRALIDAVVVWAASRGIARLSLLVFPHNTRARALYQHTGFVDVQRRADDVMRRNGTRWDTILMQREIA